MADVKPEMPCEQESKRNLAEEKVEEEDEDGPYRSDDDDYVIVGGPQADRKIWNRYFREWDESDGFDITVFPGCAINAPLVPMRSYLTNSETKQSYIDLINLAIQDFNSKNGRNFVYLDIVSVVVSYAAGMFFRFTFDAKDGVETKTFRALVWDGVDGFRDVKFCRFK